MKVLFMGTPEFAVAALEAILAAGHTVCGVYTRQDTPKNRGMKLLPPPVKRAAQRHEIPVYQPTTLKDPEVQRQIAELHPDVAVVAAYGRLLPQAVLDIPKYGCLNIHASLLPRYRGASPIQAAVLHGDPETGITVIQMDAGLDTGDMLLKHPIQIGEEESCGSVHDRLAVAGGEAITEALRRLEQGLLVPEKQPEICDSYAGMIRSEDCRVDFQNSVRQVCCQIRSFDPFPGAFSLLGEAKLKLFAAKHTKEAVHAQPGKVLGCGKDGLLVACGDGAVCIGEVQGAGGRRMPADAFFRGHPALLQEQFR